MLLIISTDTAVIYCCLKKTAYINHRIAFGPLRRKIVIIHAKKALESYLIGSFEVQYGAYFVRRRNVVIKGFKDGTYFAHLFCIRRR